MIRPNPAAMHMLERIVAFHCTNGRVPTAKELCAILNVGPRYVARLLRRLASGGYVTYTDYIVPSPLSSYSITRLPDGRSVRAALVQFPACDTGQVSGVVHCFND